ncbi:hypothetical protein E2C01_015596 [Portunus trituberculatus]|uniref:Uncharacterized protein n=1 Tax=Portunus trituberculatus TaxID=210409 RepID=A0A5B7DND3_PORTR|nr:hypothetical protein [Portunus trituberculatus]
MTSDNLGIVEAAARTAGRQKHRSDNAAKTCRGLRKPSGRPHPEGSALRNGGLFFLPNSKRAKGVSDEGWAGGWIGE